MLLYALRGERAELVVNVGIEPGLAASPEELDLEDGGTWPLAEVARSGREVLFNGLAERFGTLPGGPAGEPAARAPAPPRGRGRGRGDFVLVVGLNPRIPLDDDARSFLELLARQLATSIASTRALEEKTQRAAQLAELNHQKTQFFSNVSHEFRTPLTLILGPTEDALASPTGALTGEQLERVHGILLAAGLLTELDELSEDATHSLKRIQSAADRATRLVRDLLDFTQARLGGGIHVEPRPADLHALVRAVLEDESISFPNRRFAVHQEGEGQGAWDPDRLTQVVQNLVTNALKYSPADSAIRVQTQVLPDEVTLLVHNGGAPIPPDKLPVLFEPLQRATGQVDSASRSVGLGLYIVKQIVEAHHGTVEVKSTEAEGTTFTVRLARVVTPQL